MNKVNVLYKNRKEEIFEFYKKNKKIDVDNIQDINDYIVDNDLKKENFENPLEEFYNIVSMCLYMCENNLYDNSFFEMYDEILEDYKSNKFDEYFLNYDEDKSLLDSDIEIINDCLIKDETKNKYYDKLTEVYESELNKDTK